MKDVTEAFDDYWKTHFENLVLPINQKSEMKKIAFHAYKEGYKSEDIILRLMGGVNYTEDMLDEIKIQHLSKAIQKWYIFCNLLNIDIFLLNNYNNLN